MKALTLATSLVLVLGIGGCRPDPVHSDLVRFRQEVMERIDAIERDLGQALLPSEREAGPGKIPWHSLHVALQDRVIPGYQHVLIILNCYHPNTSPVRSIHNELVRYYQEALMALQTCLQAVRNRDEPALSHFEEALPGFENSAIAGKLERLYAEHGVWAGD
jgi:hypothetical protein